MSDQLMDTAPGGESTQYESIKTVTNPTDKQSGQLESTSSPEQTEDDPGSQPQQIEDKVAKKSGSGSGISESDAGGKTIDVGGTATHEGPDNGAAESSEKEEQAREKQGYGSGSGVGG